LNAQNVHPIKIYLQLIAVYGEGVMDEPNVRKWRRMLNEGTIMRARMLPLAHVRYLRTLLGKFFFFHPPYSPDLAPSDFHLFTHLKQFLGGTRMGSDE
jgi:hypothetical protein